MNINIKLLTGMFCLQLLLNNSGVATAQQQAVYPMPDSQQDIYYGGQPLFRLNFFDYHADSEVINVDGIKYQSTYTLSADLKQAVAKGVDYIAQLVGAQASNRMPANIYIFTYDEMNADSMSGIPGDEAAVDLLQQALISGKDLGTMAGGYIHVGIVDNSDSEAKGWDTKFDSALPANGNKYNLPATLVHEVAHALGILSNNDVVTGKFSEPLNAFSSHLYDADGKQARPGMLIADVSHKEGQDPALYAGLAPEDIFYVKGYDGLTQESGVYFSGDHVQDVLQGAKLGNLDEVSVIPITGWEYAGYDDEEGCPVIYPDISHLELRNGLMSHQWYRNYTTFMEAELAVLQDIGYKIDRRNWFGRSIYNDGTIVVNYSGYSARNAEGTAYLAGTPNNTSFGVGLHIYGSDNKVTQVGDILTDGLGGTGIRVDGLGGNEVIVSPATRIYADGRNGTGLLVAYGSGHKITTAGDIEALGHGGVASRFDFGDNILKNGTEYRGSYIFYKYDDESSTGINYDINDYALELNGPLVENFDVKGTLAGSSAIYIGANAFVKNINISNGALLYGDIVSKWMDFSELGLPNIGIQYSGADKKAGLVTQLNFNAKMDYGGNINGSYNMQLNVNGGKLVYSGKADVLAVNVDAGAQLLGGSYKLNVPIDAEAEKYESMKTGVFINKGMIGALTPTDGDTQMQIEGDLKAAGGKLQFTANKDYIGFINVTGAADITDTTMHIDEQGVYVPGKSYSAEVVRSAGTMSGSITGMDTYNSGMMGAIFNSNNVPANGAAASALGGVNITFVPEDNLGRRSNIQQQMYERVSDILSAKPYYNYDYARLYSLDAKRAKAALTSLSGGLQSELAQTVKKEHFLASAIEHRLTGAPSDSKIWAETSKSWSRYNSDTELPESKTHSFNLAIGRDKQFSDAWRAGMVLAYGQHSVTSGDARGDIDDVRFGLYGRYGNEDALNLDMYLAYGLQRNTSKRQLAYLDLQANSKYNSDILNIGTQLSRSYNLRQNSDWKIRPYLGLDGAIYRLNGYTEHGAGVYNQHADRQSDKLLTASAGVELKRDLGADSSYIFGIGYRRTLDGEAATLNAAFSEGGADFITVGNGSAKDTLTLKLQGAAKVKKNLTVSGTLLQELGADTRCLTASFNADWNF